MDPVQYPTISLNGQEIALKFRLSDILALAKDGIDIWQMKGVSLTSVEGINQTLLLLKHAIAHQQPDATVEALSAQIDFSQIAHVDSLLSQTIKKAVSQIATNIAERTTTAPTKTAPDASIVQ